MMRWVITAVHLKDCVESLNEVGRGNHPLERAEELPYRFKLFDDDGNLYYEGRSNDRDSEEAFEPLDWSMFHAGCTSIEYLQDNGSWEQL